MAESETTQLIQKAASNYLKKVGDSDRKMIYKALVKKDENFDSTRAHFYKRLRREIKGKLTNMGESVTLLEKVDNEALTNLLAAVFREDFSQILDEIVESEDEENDQTLF